MQTKTNMLRSFYFIILFICCYTSYCVAQPNVQWQKSLSGRQVLNGNESLKFIYETKAGGYIGLADSYGGSGVYLFKLDKDGKLLSQEYNESANAGQLIQQIEETKEGDFLYAGTKDTLVGTDRFFWGRLAKVGPNGNPIWTKYYKGGDITHPDVGLLGPGSTDIKTVSLTIDGGYLIGAIVRGVAGRDKSENARDVSLDPYYYSNGYYGDYWVIKTDSKGVIEWEKTLGSQNYDELEAAFQTMDSGYIAAGSVQYYSTSAVTTDASGDRKQKLRDTSWGCGDFWIVKLDKTGKKIEWEKTIGGKGAERLAFMIPTRDSGYFVGGTSTSPISGEKTEAFRGGGESYAEFAGGELRSGDFWVLKLDKTGAIVWQKTMGGDKGELLTAGYEDKDGGFVIGGTSASGISGDKLQPSYAIAQGEEDDYWVVKLTADGIPLWQKAIGGNTVDVCDAMYPTKNGGFIIGGHSYSPVSGMRSAPLLVPLYESVDIWLVKFGPNQINGTICPESSYSFDGKDINLPGVYESTTYVHTFDGSDSLVELTLNYFEATPPTVQVQQDLLSVTETYASYAWLFNGAAIPGATGKSYVPKDEGLYQLVVTNTNGCKDTSTAYHPIFKSNVFIPNMFSPNGDGKNDLFRVLGNNLTYAHLVIYNQWGEKIFETNDALTTGWDGRINGKLLPVGVYMYTIQIGEASGNVIKQKGNVTIVR